jgi:hypothetical protein
LQEHFKILNTTETLGRNPWNVFRKIVVEKCAMFLKLCWNEIGYAVLEWIKAVKYFERNKDGRFMWETLNLARFSDL